MQRIQCELCHSTDMVKEGEFFVCQHCGCKYTLEDARAMISISGTVSIDDTKSRTKDIENYLQLAEIALKDMNTQDALKYSEMVLEIDASNYKAWSMKAKAIAWSSSLEDLRFKEAVTAAKKAFEFAPSIEKCGISTETYLSMKAAWNILFSRALQIKKANIIIPTVHSLMLNWILMITSIRCLPKDLVKDEVSECQELCEAPRMFEFGRSHANINVVAAWKSYNNRQPYNQVMEKALGLNG